MRRTLPPSQNPQALAYEKSIPTSVRLRNGQYYTPSSVCDFMLALSAPPNHSNTKANPEPWRILEPGCGSGNFLLRLINRLEAQLPQSENTQPIELYGIDSDPGATELAQALIPSRGKAYKTVIQTSNFITPEIDRLGLFDWIIGNPPYVRQEHIAQSQHVDKKAMLAYLLAKYENYLQYFPAQKVLFSQTADLYLWFFLQATSLLKVGGRLSFITSNSWLNTAYGQHFQQFLTHHFHVLTLVESACERWFSDAAINPLIVVLEKKSTAYQQQNFLLQDNIIPTQSGQINTVNLIRLLTPLQKYLQDSDEPNYWQQLDKKIQQIQNQDSNDEIQINRVDLKKLQSPPLNAHWLLPLRASMEFTDLLATPMLWQTLEELGQVRYPLKTGINAFFYLSAAQAAQWQIEPEFLFPVLRSSRQVKGYVVQANELREFLFSCPFTTQELEAQGKNGALAYIQWGETQSSPPRQKRAHATPWPQVPSVKSNHPWHYTKPLAPAHLLCPRFIDQRFFFPLCEGAVMEDQTFYGFTVAKPSNHSPALLGALLNGTLSYLLAEYSARTNLGEGVLQFARCDMGAFSIINPDLYLPAEKKQLLESFQALCNRPILPLEQELFNPDRLQLDAMILIPALKAIDPSIDAMAVRERMANQLLARVQERQKLANSVRRKSQLNLTTSTMTT